MSQITLHVTIAAICNILRTSDAFQMQSIKPTGISFTPPRQIDPTMSLKSPSSSSLHVLSSPRRRTTSGKNNIINIPSPIELDTNLWINCEETNSKDSYSKPLASTGISLSPLASTDVTTIQVSRAPSTKPISPTGTIVGAASRSALFRGRHLSTAQKHYDSSDFSAQPQRNDVSLLKSQELNTDTSSSQTSTITELKTVEELNKYWPRCLEQNEKVSDAGISPLSQDTKANPEHTIDYIQLLRGLSVKGDTQIIGSKDHPDFVHPVVQLMHDRKRQQEAEQKAQSNCSTESQPPKKKKEKIALVVEGGGMRGCVSAGMVCAIHCLGLSDTIDVVYGSSAGAVIAAYFVSKQLPYFGPEVYYDSLTTMEDETVTKLKQDHAATLCSQDGMSRRQHVVDHYRNNYFIDEKRMTRSMGLGLCDPRLLKDVWTRRIHGKPMMNLHYMFESIMMNKKRIDYETFVERQKIQPLKVVATGLSSEKAVLLSHEGGHFDSLEDLCNSLHASCLLPGIAGPVMNVLKRISRNSKGKAESVTPTSSNVTQQKKPNFLLRNIHRKRELNDEDYEPLGDAMLSAPIPYDIAHDEGATHVLVIRSSSDGTNLMEVPPIMAWIGSRIYKRYFLKKNHLPRMYKRSQTEQRHQRVYAKTILELNKRANFPPSADSDEDQTMTIALEPGSEDVSHLETTREGIFEGVRQGFARAYDALVEDPAMRGRGKEMALLFFPDEILDYDPNDPRLSCSMPANGKDAALRSSFEEYLSTSGVVPKTWLANDNKRHAMS